MENNETNARKTSEFSVMSIYVSRLVYLLVVARSGIIHLVFEVVTEHGHGF